MAISKHQNKGASVIELLTVIFIIGFTLTALLGLISFSLKSLNFLKETTRANLLAQEAMEAVRNFRDNNNWNVDGLGTLNDGVSYHPEKTGSPQKWTLVSGEEIINSFTRKVVFDLGHRDANYDIVEVGGSPDPNTKKVTVTVSWGSRKVELITYLTNWR